MQDLSYRTIWNESKSLLPMKRDLNSQPYEKTGRAVPSRLSSNTMSPKLVGHAGSVDRIRCSESLKLRDVWHITST